MTGTADGRMTLNVCDSFFAKLCWIITSCSSASGPNCVVAHARKGDREKRAGKKTKQ